MTTALIDMDKAKAQKIDDLLSSVSKRSQQRKADREGRIEITWDSFSVASQEVLEHFGLDAPHILNKYVCSVEDALIEMVDRLKKANATIEELKEGNSDS